MKIYKGAMCKVIGGTDGLNIGKTVIVASLQGERRGEWLVHSTALLS